MMQKSNAVGEVRPKYLNENGVTKKLLRGSEKDRILAMAYDTAVQSILQSKISIIEGHLRFEPTATFSEIQFYQIIASITKMRFMSSVWIGQRNVDILFPQLKTPNGKAGIAIEVNGDIHERIFKMSKDNHLREILAMLGILTLTVENHSLTNQTTKNLITSLKGLKRISSREEKRFIRGIALFTVMTSSFKTNIVEAIGVQSWNKLVTMDLRYHRLGRKIELGHDPINRSLTFKRKPHDHNKSRVP